MNITFLFIVTSNDVTINLVIMLLHPFLKFNSELKPVKSPVKLVLDVERFYGAIALSYPRRVRVRAMVKLSAAFFHDESSITIGGYESAIAPILYYYLFR